MVVLTKDKNASEDFSIDRFRGDSIPDFRFVYNEYYGLLSNFANALIDNKVEAQDIATECFIRLWSLRKNLDFAELKNIRAFLFVSVRNACMDYLRAMKRLKNNRAGLLPLLGEGFSGYPEKEGVSEEEFDELIRQIDLLPFECQKIFKLFFFHQMNTREVARKLGKTKRNVLTQKNRAVQLLREALSKDKKG